MITVSIDQGMCIGSRNCVVVAPAVFTSDEDDFAELKGDAKTTSDTVSDIYHETVRRAAHGCPTAAITLDET